MLSYSAFAPHSNVKPYFTVPKMCPTGRCRTVPNVTERNGHFSQAFPNIGK